MSNRPKSGYLDDLNSEMHPSISRIAQDVVVKNKQVNQFQNKEALEDPNLVSVPSHTQS